MAELHLFDANSIEWSEHPQFPGLFIKILETRATHPGASVTLTRVSVGCSIGTHTHPVETETAYLLSGTARLVAADNEYILAPESGATVPPGIAHSLHNTGDVEVLLIAVHVPPVR